MSYTPETFLSSDLLERFKRVHSVEQDCFNYFGKYLPYFSDEDFEATSEALAYITEEKNCTLQEITAALTLDALFFPETEDGLYTTKQIQQEEFFSTVFAEVMTCVDPEIQAKTLATILQSPLPENITSTAAVLLKDLRQQQNCVSPEIEDACAWQLGLFARAKGELNAQKTGVIVSSEHLVYQNKDDITDPQQYTYLPRSFLRGLARNRCDN